VATRPRREESARRHRGFGNGMEIVEAPGQEDHTMDWKRIALLFVLADFSALTA